MYIDKIQLILFAYDIILVYEFFIMMLTHDINIFFHYDVNYRHILDCHFKSYFWY